MASVMGSKIAEVMAVRSVIYHLLLIFLKRLLGYRGSITYVDQRI